MSHDLEASWSSVELANLLKNDTSIWNSGDISSDSVSTFATHEKRKSWPYPDGSVVIEHAQENYRLALEFKRQNEGIHGVLTALGQGYAYLHKGFSGSLIVIPEDYETRPGAAEYLRDVIENTYSDIPIGVFGYQAADPSLPSPFEGKITCFKTMNRLSSALPSVSSNRRTETQWAHIREGSTYPDAFFKYLKEAKNLSPFAALPPSEDQVPQGLIDAVSRLDPDADVVEYLSNSRGNSFHDIVWQNFWFKNVIFEENLNIWTINNGNYEVVNIPTRILQPDGSSSTFFSYRSDSIKQKIVSDLNASQLDERTGWEKFAQNVRNRAHSFREDIDSGLEAFGLLDEDGSPTELGFKFVNAAERNQDDANSGRARSLFYASMLQIGNLGSFLHYVHKLSEQMFKDSPLLYTTLNGSNASFNKNAYLGEIERLMESELKVLRKVSQRGGTSRSPFQAELALLRQSNLAGGFRTGIGLEINWPKVQEMLEVGL